ncbi:MAG: ribose 5-phosphate isomerase B [Deltaproteobacteria bacterium]|jgi:ribose 5-phosphate isomerase B|nr:ribose 5-phosphate isomerase B [Deltaproteobacteria bacterium]
MLEGSFFIGSDHAGFFLKNTLKERMISWGLRVEDCGTHSPASCDYPEMAHKVCSLVLARNGYGVLVCGTGIGMSMTANRHKGIRAALCTHIFHARASRAHNNANILCLGQRVTAPELSMEILSAFLETPYEGGRHDRRLELMEKI